MFVQLNYTLITTSRSTTDQMGEAAQFAVIHVYVSTSRVIKERRPTCRLCTVTAINAVHAGQTL